jgi:hypothetical protein
MTVGQGNTSVLRPGNMFVAPVLSSTVAVLSIANLADHSGPPHDPSHAPVRAWVRSLCDSGTFVGPTTGFRNGSTPLYPSNIGTTCRSRPHFRRGETELQCR